MITLFKILVLMALLPVIMAGSLIGLLYHSFMAGVLWSETALDALIKD